MIKVGWFDSNYLWFCCYIRPGLWPSRHDICQKLWFRFKLGYGMISIAKRFNPFMHFGKDDTASIQRSRAISIRFTLLSLASIQPLHALRTRARFAALKDHFGEDAIFRRRHANNYFAHFHQRACDKLPTGAKLQSATTHFSYLSPLYTMTHCILATPVLHFPFAWSISYMAQWHLSRYVLAMPRAILYAPASGQDIYYLRWSLPSLKYSQYTLILASPW